MSILDIRKSRMVYIASIFICIIFSIVYEHFSHEVFSYYLILSFMIPFIGLLLNEIEGRFLLHKNNLSVQLLAGSVIWLTLGSIFKGILDIYGTTNHLLIIFLIVGSIQLLLSFIVLLISKFIL